MPDYDTRTTTTTTSDTASGSQELQQDPQTQMGNAAIMELLRDQSQSSMSANDTLWAGAEAGAEGFLSRPDLQDGTTYKVTEDDMEWSESATWRKIAKNHGMLDKTLVAFNQHVQSVDTGDGVEVGESVTAKLEAGVDIYIPSADEIVYSDCSHKAGGDLAKATEYFNGVAATPALDMMRTARARASGKLGVGYGTPGDNGVFYTQNPEIAGASSRRSEQVNGETEYRVNWGVDFWKCSVFMHDVAYSAGYKPDMTENDHYRLAGHLQWSKDYNEVNVGSAKPGHAWQRFGGSKSNESHNAILSSFVEVEDVDEEYERWTFKIVGAESDRAAESERSHLIKKGTNENQQGKKIRFFEPKSAR